MTMIDDNKLVKKQALTRALLASIERPPQFLTRTAVVFVSFELFLIAMHFVATSFFGDIANRTADGHIGGFDLNDEATVAVWFSSFQLLLVSIACLLNSWTDETLAGRLPARRVWKFGFYLFFVMAVDETGGLHEIFGKALAILFPALPISPSLWWTIPYAAGVAVFLLFLIYRLIWQPTLLALLGLFVASWFVANALEHIQLFDMAVNFAIEEGLEMFGATIMLLVLCKFLVRQLGHSN